MNKSSIGGKKMSSPIRIENISKKYLNLIDSAETAAAASDDAHHKAIKVFVRKHGKVLGDAVSLFDSVCDYRYGGDFTVPVITKTQIVLGKLVMGVSVMQNDFSILLSAIKEADLADKNADKAYTTISKINDALRTRYAAAAAKGEDARLKWLEKWLATGDAELVAAFKKAHPTFLARRFAPSTAKKASRKVGETGKKTGRFGKKMGKKMPRNGGW